MKIVFRRLACNELIEGIDIVETPRVCFGVKLPQNITRLERALVKNHSGPSIPSMLDAFFASLFRLLERVLGMDEMATKRICTLVRDKGADKYL